jgi:excisionase family DNA binding protein
MYTVAEPEALPEPPLLLTVPQTAALLAMSEAQVYRLLSDGDLPSLKIGRLRRVRRDWLLHWLDRQTATRQEYNS